MVLDQRTLNGQLKVFLLSCKVEELDLQSAWRATQSIRHMVDRDYENRIKLIRETWQQREAAEFDLAAEREMLGYDIVAE